MLAFDKPKHEYRWNGAIVPHVTGVLASMGLYPPYPDDGSAARGSIVHEVIAAYLRGVLDVEAWRKYDQALHPEQRVSPYVDAAIQFVRDSALKPIKIEERMYCPKLGVAGTVDVEAIAFEMPFILDWKCSESDPPERATAAQTAALALLAGYDEGNRINRAAVRLSRNATYKLLTYDDPNDYRAFRAYLLAYKYKHTTR